MNYRPQANMNTISLMFGDTRYKYYDVTLHARQAVTACSTNEWRPANAVQLYRPIGFHQGCESGEVFRSVAILAHAIFSKLLPKVGNHDSVFFFATA